MTEGTQSEKFSPLAEGLSLQPIEALLALGVDSREMPRPNRCRAIIIDPHTRRLLCIARQKPGREPYAVYPGGGLEEYDKTPAMGLQRELEEELRLTPELVTIAERAIVLEGEAFFVCLADQETLGTPTIGGPESDRDPAIAGVYTPQWVSVDDLLKINLQPENITRLVDSKLASIHR